VHDLDVLLEAVGVGGGAAEGLPHRQQPGPRQGRQRFGVCATASAAVPLAVAAVAVAGARAAAQVGAAGPACLGGHGRLPQAGGQVLPRLIQRPLHRHQPLLQVIVEARFALQYLRQVVHLQVEMRRIQ